MSKYEITLGLEIHLELNTKTKMFSSSPIVFNALPNTLINEVDLGYPGSLPTVNQEGVFKALKIAKALNMEIDLLLRFDRKNYFYPDLPKGFQITQQFHPLGQNGYLTLNSGQKIMIERLHIEEDTAKSIHHQDVSWLDYNRAGNPLVEIVTKPCLKSSHEVAEYIEWIKNLALTLDVSDAKMEQGSMRVDVNLSLKPKHSQMLGTKVEIKNLNSINNVIKAIEYEIILQTQLLDQNFKIKQATKRFDELSNQTVTMRIKNDSIDYKYFPEPNIPPIKISQQIFDRIKLPELPWEKRQRYLKLNIDVEFINQLLNSLDKTTFFDNITVSNYNEAAKIFFNEIVPIANKHQCLISQLNIDPQTFSQVIELLINQKISRVQVKTIIFKIINKQGNLKEILNQFDFSQIIDKSKLSEIIKEIINQNQLFIQNNQDRQERILKFIMGKVMQVTERKADAKIVMELIKDLLN